MIRRVFAYTLLSLVAISGSTLVPSKARGMQDSCREGRDAWVADNLAKMESIRAGMTRGQLMQVFTTQGGFSNGLRRTFVSRECLYFKVDVEFKPFGRPDRDSNGRVTVEEDARDVIVKISRPYLEFAVTD